jgi:hypothetical protein
MVVTRRGQRATKDAPATTADAPTTATSTKPSLADQLDRAEVAVLKARDATAQLHVWWRQHLFRLSLLVLLLCLHQTQKPSAECIKNIKVCMEYSSQKLLHKFTLSQCVTVLILCLQAANKDISQYSGFDAVYYILNDSVVEIMGLVMMSSLAYFLYDETKPAKFNEPTYMISTMLVPMQLATYFQQPLVGCAHVMEGAEAVDRAFPVSMIYHMIVTLSCFFMNYQMAHRNKAIKAVVTMRKNLAEAERQADASSDTKKKGKGAISSKKK